MSSKFLSKWRWKLLRPEYIYRPTQLFRRIGRKLRTRKPSDKVQLPWGLRLCVGPPELVTNGIYYKGVYDVALSETIWRLLDDGETCLDIGAHIGYVTSLMAARVGAAGRVVSFEPHPNLHAELQANAALWPQGTSVARVEIHNLALSETAGQMSLAIPADWQRNRGVAHVATAGELLPAGGVTVIPVLTQTLDNLLGETTRVGVAKLDVETHEVFVLRGAQKLLARGAIRDILFEDFGEYPSPAMQLLETHGYTLFSLARHLRRPHLAGMDLQGVLALDNPNYLATLEPQRAIERMSKTGWRVLQTRAARAA